MIASKGECIECDADSTKLLLYSTFINPENAKLMQDFLEAELKCADLEDAMKELRTKRTPFEMQEKNIELKKQVRRLEV